jgi:protein-tyrosine kinase
MGKIYEALKRAEEEKQQFESKLSESRYTSLLDDFPGKAVYSMPLASEEALDNDLQIHVPSMPVKTILFTGTSPKCGTSRTAVSYATSLARDTNKKILLVDANLSAPTLHEVFNIDNSLGGLSELCNDKIKIEAQIRKLEPDNFSVLPCYRKHSSLSGLFGSIRFDNFLKMTEELFDYVILDGPPISRFSESLLISSKVNGVVMVIISGKTRRQVALRAKAEIERSGGRLLGVVLNRRKYYIPSWIYNRL